MPNANQAKKHLQPKHKSPIKTLLHDYSTSFRACQQGFVTPEKGTENEKKSETKIDQYQSCKDFAEDTEIRELLSLLFALPADAFLSVWLEWGKIMERQREKEKEARDAKEERV